MSERKKRTDKRGGGALLLSPLLSLNTNEQNKQKQKLPTQSNPKERKKIKSIRKIKKKERRKRKRNYHYIDLPCLFQTLFYLYIAPPLPPSTSASLSSLPSFFFSLRVSTKGNVLVGSSERWAGKKRREKEREGMWVWLCV
jgi:hypothetical protein